MINYNDKISTLVQEVPVSGLLKFFDLINQSEGIISLSLGEPDYATPWHIREAAWKSLEKGDTMYTPNWGLLELREAISVYEASSIGVTYDPQSDILITVGVSEALDLACRALLNPGDEVLIPEPAYVAYSPCVSLAYGQPVPMQLSNKDEYRLRPETIEKYITPKTKAVVLAFPNNPTGAVMSSEDLTQLIEVLVKYDLLVLSDEIYRELTYDGKHTSIASLPGMRERTVLLNGFSKAYAMTGWRIGYACGPTEIITAMNKIHQYTIMCAPIMSQKAALEALLNGETERNNMVNSYNHRRLLLLNGLRNIGLECFEPRGAFYCFPSIKNTGLSSMAFCEQLLEKEKVAVIPGTAFGQWGEGHIRCCYAASVPDLQEAIVRMGRFIDSLKK